MTHESIIEKITTILNSENTTKFLNNITMPLGNETKKPIIMRGQSVVNSFLINIFPNIEITNNKKTIKNLIINNKRIKVCSISNKSSYISFNCFEYREGAEFNIKKNLENTKEKLELYEYFLIILVHEGKHDSDFKVKYNFYLIPASFFYFDDKIWYMSGRTYRGKNWSIQCKKEFRIKIDTNNLRFPIFSYSY